MLRARLLGGLGLTWQSDPLPVIVGRPARSLLAFLLTYRGQPHTRDLLAGTFWPELPDSTARRRLSQALWQIRNALDPHPIILTEGGTIQIDPDLNLWIDVEEFGRLVDWGIEKLGQQSTNLPIYQPTDLAALDQAVDLYRGDFMAGYYDDWVIVERERLREMLLDVLARLVVGYKRGGEYERALHHARRLASEDPWREEAHCEVMRLCHLLGRGNEALKQFKICRQALVEELGAEPSPETVGLAQEIAFHSGHATVIDLPSAHHAPGAIGLDRPDGVRDAGLPLVGREEERAQLLTHVTALLRGLGGLLLVEGEAGVGKTRLLQTIAGDAEWRGAEVLWGVSREVERATPYAPLVEALGQELTSLRVSQLEPLVEGLWLQVLAPVLPPLARLLPDLPPPPALDPAQERSRLVAALAQFLGSWAQVAPLLLVLEDLHRAGEDTLDLLARLASGGGTRGVLIVGSYRRGEARALPRVWDKLQALDQAGVQRRLELKRLDASATGELVRRCLGTAGAAPLFEARLYQETQGNPLFVLETLRALHDEGLLAQDSSGHWSTPWDETTADYAELPLPPAVEQTIARRLDSLSPALRRTLDLAAVLGERFGFDLLHAASDDEPQAMLAALRQLAQRRFLDETETDYRFSHDKVRQVAYDRIEKAARAELHRQVAQALVSLAPDRPATLAHHWMRAGVWEQAADHYRQAGDRARAVYANAEAVSHYTRALQALDRLPGALEPRYTALLAREQVHHLMGEREAQAQDLQSLAALAQRLDDDQKRAEVALRQANYANVTSDYPAAIAAAQEAIRLSRAVPGTQLEAAGYLQWGETLWRMGTYQNARIQLARALSLARAASLAQVEADSLRHLGIVCWYLTEYARASTYYEQALSLCREIGDRQGERSNLHNLGILAHYQGDYAGAASYYEQSLRTCREIGNRESEATALNNLGDLARARGEFSQSEELYRRALHIFCEIGSRWGESRAHANLGEVFRRRADYAAAAAHFHQSLHIKHEIGERGRGTESLLNSLGSINRYQGNYTEARACFERLLAIGCEIGDRLGQSMALGNIGLVALDMGDYSTADDYFHQALDLGREINDRQLVGVWTVDLGRLYHQRGDQRAALRHCQEALHLFEEIGHRSHQGYALTYLGHVYAAVDQMDEAAAAYRQAVDLRRTLGQQHLAAESLAGLVRVALAQGKATLAQTHAEEILNYLETSSLDGTDEPCRICLNCYQALEAHDDPRAGTVLTTAYELLQARAAKIDDEGLRCSFLENVAAHRELVAAYRIYQATPQKKQVTVALPRADAPQGRPLRDGEYVAVTWTLATPEDEAIESKVDRRCHRLLRLLGEAWAQDAIPRDQDLADALDVSLTTLRRDVAALRDQGHALPPRRRTR